MVKFLEKTNQNKSYLLLQDGSLFEGYSFGAECDTDGEIGKFSAETNAINKICFRHLCSPFY